jgi:Domain of unknown function (DUF4278)
MKLQFLGSTYTQPESTIETVETNTELSFLGRSFKMRATTANQPSFPAGYLTYRGVSYRAHLISFIIEGSV